MNLASFTSPRSRTTHRSTIRLGSRPSHPVPSRLGPLAVGLRGLAQQEQVPEQHDGWRHDHPPGRHLGARQRPGRGAQRHEHQQQPPPRRLHPPVDPDRNRAGPGAPRSSSENTGAARRSGGAIRPPPSRRHRYGSRRGRRPRLLLGARIIRGLRRARRTSIGIGMGSSNRRVPPKPPGNEHDGPDHHDRDVKDRATQQSSPGGRNSRNSRNSRNERNSRNMVAGRLLPPSVLT